MLPIPSFIGSDVSALAVPLFSDKVATDYLYSFSRKQRAAYSGYAFKVRRTSDNTKADIGYLSTGAIDGTAISTFCASTDGYIDTIYDNGLLGLHISSQGTTHEYRIALNGVVDVKNGKPSAYIVDAARGYVSPTFTTYTGTTICVAMVGSIVSTSPTARVLSVLNSGGAFDDNTGTNGGILIYNPTTSLNFAANRNGSQLSVATATSGQLASVISVFNGAVSNIWIDNVTGTTPASSAVFSTNRLTFSMATPTTFASRTGAYISEANFKISAGAWDSTARGIAYNDQKAFYGTP